ncbi:MAG: ABC transporter permease [Nitrospinaceae bacterium]|jgi:lipopolysaccharide transport system permease protein|nr:ABC transporter permease [Nitrospinaceae bacterium]MBT6717522.1 ABC transporter permease [Nitrospina sp.]
MMTEETNLEVGIAQDFEELHVTIIQPPKGLVSLGLKELWEYWELLYFLTWRDIKVRYKQTLLGGLWAILQPFCMMVVFSLFFGKLAQIPSDGVPYPIFAYAGLLPWTFFSKGMTDSANSLVGSQNLITKVYFPRLVIPISSVLSGVVDFFLAFTVLIGMMVYYEIYPSMAIFFLLPLLLLALVSSLGVGLWLSAVNVKYRDVRYTLPFLVQFWLFATPVAYPSSLLSEPWRTVYGINPMVGVVEGFRWALLGAGSAPGAMIAVSSLVSIIIFVSGMYYFRKMERVFADIV